MKVLNYLQYKQSVHNPEFINMLIKLGFKDTEQFYSQPFKPEMITELFDGWTLYAERGYCNSFRNSANSNIDIWRELNQIDYDRDVKDSLCGETETTKPRTLDDFINDCQRAGIELEWKK